jgi:hypothetical protein
MPIRRPKSDTSANPTSRSRIRSAISPSVSSGATTSTSLDMISPTARTEELLEWPGRVQVGGLLLEGGSDGLGVEVVEVEQELVGVDRLDAERLAGGGREAVEVAGDDELGVGGDRGGEDVPILGIVGHRRLEPLDHGSVDLGFLERFAHRGLDPIGLLGGDPVLDEVARHLLEDPGAPERRVELELCEPQQRVAERETGRGRWRRGPR